jgi:hypothetical protein
MKASLDATFFTSALKATGWVLVVTAADCKACEDCSEPVCPVCIEHYADCACPGPHQDDEFEYCEVNGVLVARRLPGSLQ